MGFETAPMPEEEIPQQKIEHYPEPVHYPEQAQETAKDYEYFITLEENAIKDIEGQMERRHTPVDIEATNAINLHKEKIKLYRAKIERLKQD